MNILLPLLFITFSLGQLARISFLGQTINTYAYEILLLPIVVIWIFRYKMEPLKSAYKNFRYLFIFLGTLFLSFVITLWEFDLTENIVAALYIVRITLYAFFLIYFSYALKKQHQLSKIYKKGFAIFAALTAVLSITQYFLYPNLRNVSYQGWDPHQYRVFGVFLDTSVAAAVLGLIILYFLFRHKKIYAGIFGVLGLFTYSRGFYLSIVLALAYHLARKKQYALIAVFIGATAALLFTLPRPEGESANLLRHFTISARAEDYKKAVEITSKSPILGVGYNRIRSYKDAAPMNHAGASFHSSFLIILATAGMIGLVAFILLLFQLAKISYIASIYVLFLSVFSLTDNILLHPFILFLLFGQLAVEVRSFVIARTPT